jgi:hypothetical protein
MGSSAGDQNALWRHSTIRHICHVRCTGQLAGNFMRACGWRRVCTKALRTRCTAFLLVDDDNGGRGVHRGVHRGGQAAHYAIRRFHHWISPSLHLAEFIGWGSPEHEMMVYDVTNWAWDCSILMTRAQWFIQCTSVGYDTPYLACLLGNNLRILVNLYHYPL